MCFAAHAAAPVDVAGSYSDPNHPTGYRRFAVDGQKAVVTGADGPKESEWTLQAAVDGDKVTLFLDDGPVRPEAYDPTSVDMAQIDGQYVKKFTGTFTADGKRVGIAWPDGNFWTKQ